MSDITLNPYIFFQGNCRKALEFYQSIFGGELYIQTYEESGQTATPEMKDKLMHASLTSGLITLMGSDTEQASAKAAKVSLSLNGSDEERLTKIFNRLSEGVEIQYPLKKEF
jgi:PhnB protein